LLGRQVGEWRHGNHECAPQLRVRVVRR
jgi:hypothetical protein